MINQLHISHVDYQWDNQLTLLTQHNFNKIINEKNLIDCCTSPEDISYEYLHQACDAAVQIQLVDFDFDNASFDNFEIYGRLLNELARQKHKILQEIPPWRHDLPLTSRPAGPLLWTSGCSFTYGSAVTYYQRFGHLVAKALERQEVCLAQGGASLFFSADRILRADLEPGDIVLWGLTNVSRVEIAKQWKLSPVTILGYPKVARRQQYWNLDWFGSSTQTLLSLHYIDQVQNFCKKIGVELYIVNMLDIEWMSVYAAKYANYIDLAQDLKIKNNVVSLIDYAPDNQHPGPIQHRQWADKITQFIKNQHIVKETI
jgi:hypothetical protein